MSNVMNMSLDEIIKRGGKGRSNNKPDIASRLGQPMVKRLGTNGKKSGNFAQNGKKRPISSRIGITAATVPAAGSGSRVKGILTAKMKAKVAKIEGKWGKKFAGKNSKSFPRNQANGKFVTDARLLLKQKKYGVGENDARLKIEENKQKYVGLAPVKGILKRSADRNSGINRTINLKPETSSAGSRLLSVKVKNVLKHKISVKNDRYQGEDEEMDVDAAEIVKNIKELNLKRTIVNDQHCAPALPPREIYSIRGVEDESRILRESPLILREERHLPMEHRLIERIPMEIRTRPDVRLRTQLDDVLHERVRVPKGYIIREEVTRRDAREDIARRDREELVRVGCGREERVRSRDSGLIRIQEEKQAKKEIRSAREPRLAMDVIYEPRPSIRQRVAYGVKEEDFRIHRNDDEIMDVVRYEDVRKMRPVKQVPAEGHNYIRATAYKRSTSPIYTASGRMSPERGMRSDRMGRRGVATYDRYEASGSLSPPCVEKRSSSLWSKRLAPTTSSRYADTAVTRPKEIIVERQLVSETANGSNSSYHPGYRVIVSNLNAGVNQRDIVELFEDLGEILEATILFPGTAEVIYKTKEAAHLALAVYNNRLLDGQPMNCTLVGVDRSGETPLVVPKMESSKKSKVSLMRRSSMNVRPSPNEQITEKALFQ